MNEYIFNIWAFGFFVATFAFIEDVKNPSDVLASAIIALFWPIVIPARILRNIMGQ